MPSRSKQAARKNDSTSGTETTADNRNCNRGQQKKEEDFCFVCFGGGDLIVCYRQYCPKAYHPHCINQEKSYSTESGWNCEWHTCSNCEKVAHYLCPTCTYSLCKGCIKEAEYSRGRGKKGFCKICMEILALIEKNDQGKKEMPMDVLGEDSSDGDSEGSDGENQSSDEDDEDTPEKSPTESATKTTVPESEAELITPQNIGPGGKKTAKTPVKKAKKRTPKPARNIVCMYCGKKFRKDYSLQSHTEAKHSYALQSHAETKHSTALASYECLL